ASAGPAKRARAPRAAIARAAAFRRIGWSFRRIVLPWLKCSLAGFGSAQYRLITTCCHDRRPKERPRRDRQGLEPVPQGRSGAVVLRQILGDRLGVGVVDR